MKRTILIAIASAFLGGIVSPAALFAAGELTGTGIILTRTTATGFKLWAREGVEGFPVASIQPTKNNAVVALDVFPKGVPVERRGAGFAWQDTCDGDIQTQPGAVCLRNGARSEAMEMGARAVGGAASKPLWITMDGDPAIVVDTLGNTAIEGQLVLKGPNPPPCTTSRAGMIAFNRTTKQFLGCNGASYRRLD